MAGKFLCIKIHQVFIVKGKKSKQTNILKRIAMFGRDFKISPSPLVLLFFISCQQNCIEYHVHGNDCKLWLLFDKTITDSGETPFILCFDKENFNCYSIRNNGTLSKKTNDDVIYDLTRGGKWKIQNDSMFINNMGVCKKNVNNDIIVINKEIYLVDVTDKYNIENCDSENLIANFKGGSIDSVNTILDYNK